jgi:hypothetical protein
MVTQIGFFNGCTIRRAKQMIIYPGAFNGIRRLVPNRIKTRAANKINKTNRIKHLSRRCPHACGMMATSF